MTFSKPQFNYCGFFYLYLLKITPMKKILFLLLLSIASYGQTPTGQEQEFDYGIKNNAAPTVAVPNYLTTQGSTGVYGKIEPINLSISSATQNALDMKLNISDLPTNLTLYPTTAASDVAGYVKMVTDIHDADYNSVAVDVSTPAITTTAQLISQRISAPGVLIGQPGFFNITSFGNIRLLSGSGTSTFYFQVYHRNLAGVETLICTSSTSAPVTLSTYVEFTASGVWNDGEFLTTDRIVVKTYANRIAGGSDPVYQFQFGGATPVRLILPVPFSVVDAGYEIKTNKQNSLAVDGTGTKYATVDAVNAALPTTYAKIVYVNATSPTTATIFDLNNPPVTNDDLLKNDASNLYIGTDVSNWVYNGSAYVTKVVPASSNFYIAGTLTDAGNNKTSDIYRPGGSQFGGSLYSSAEIVSKKGGSDTVNLGSTFRLANNAGSENNTFQLNASNGVDLWNFSAGTWNKRFTFSNIGNLTLHTTPTTSAGAYHVLTINDSTGEVERTTISGGTGTVTSVSVVTSNGISGSVATATTTPAITLTMQDATTSQSGQLTSTDWNTFNTKASTVLTVRKISTNTTLSNTDNGTIILLTASCTVTLPNGLMSGFNCSFSTQAGVTMTYVLGGSVVLINNTGTTMAEKLSHTIVNTGVSNEYLTAGSL